MTDDRMTDVRTTTRRHVCVIGAGPRGTSVLERICANAREADRATVVHVVDPYPPGPGAVWRTRQSEHLLMNTVASQVSLFTDGSVDCEGPLVPGPSLYAWARDAVRRGARDELPEGAYAEAARLGPDDYPTRAFYGHYLAWVFRHLVRTAPRRVRVVVHAQAAVALDDTADGRQAVTLADGTRLAALDTVVLALGHGPQVRSPEQQARLGFARRHGLAYVEPANPADVDLDGFAAGEPVALNGLGLNFFDYLALLTAGRGGRFERAGGGLVYRPSGREPVLYAGSRRGIPYHARGRNQKGPHGRYLPRFLTDDVIAELRRRAEAGGPAGFRETVWPLVDREVRGVYYETVIRNAGGEQAAAAFTAAFLRCDPGGAAERALLDAHRIPADLRWSWERIQRPYGDREFTDRSDFHRWLLGHLREDVAEAERGNLTSPLKTALDVLRDLRNEVRLVVDHRGITGASYEAELDRWYSPLNAFTSIGPPARRIEELIALVEAGVVHLVGPRTQIRTSAADRAFLVRSAVVPGEPVAVRGLIEARLPAVDLRRTANPLLRYLLSTGQALPYRIDGYTSGGLAVGARPYRTISWSGRAHPARFAFGVPTEGVHWVTAAGIRPGVGSVTLTDADAIARAALGSGSDSDSASNAADTEGLLTVTG